MGDARNDVAAQAAKAGAKAAGVVIDDAAVTPRYVVGFSSDRELPIIAKIAAGLRERGWREWRESLAA